MAKQPTNRPPADPVATTGTGHAVASKSDQSIGSLIKELVDDGRRLLRDEVELARAETAEKVDRVTSNVNIVIIGAAILIAALLVLANAASTGMIALFEQFMDATVAMWLGPLVLGVVLALIGYGMVKKAIATIRHIDPVPRRSVESTKETTRWAKDRM